jgi:transposase
LVFDNSREGFEKLLLQVEAIKVEHGLERVVLGWEPTGNYHKPLGEYLIRKGHDVVLVGGTAVKKNRELLDNRWDKHDTKDAANVADLISQGKCLFYEYPSLALRELRDLLSFKRRLKKQEHGYRVRIRNHLLAQYFPEMDSYYEQSDVSSKVLGAIGDPFRFQNGSQVLKLSGYDLRVRSRLTCDLEEG